MGGGPVIGSNSMYPPTSAPYPSGPPPGILPPMMSTMGPPPHIQVSLLLIQIGLILLKKLKVGFLFYIDFVILGTSTQYYEYICTRSTTARCFLKFCSKLQDASARESPIYSRVSNSIKT